MPEFPHYSPGDPPVFSAAEVNAWNLAARDLYARKGGNNLSPQLTELFDPANLVLVRNDAGRSLAAFSVLTPTGVLVDPLNFPHDVRRRPAFSAAAPAAATDPPLVTIDPLDKDQIGRAVVSGATVATVNVSDTGHNYAVPVAGDPTGLASAGTGPVRILYKPTGTGVKTCVVLLGVRTTAFSGARVSQSTPQTIPNAVETTLLYDTVLFNVGDNYTASVGSAGWLTVPADGYYLVGARAWAEFQNGGGWWMYVKNVFVSVVPVCGNGGGGLGLGSGLETPMTATTVVQASAGDKFSSTIFQNTGAPQTPTASPNRCAEFWITRLG